LEDSELYQALLNIVREFRLPQGMEKLVALAHAADPYDEAVKVCRRFNWAGLGDVFTEKFGKLIERKKLKPQHTGLILVLDETNLDCGAGIRVEAGVAARKNDDYEWSAVPEVELGEIRLPALERLYEKIDAEWAWDILLLYGFTGLALQQALAQLGRERFLKGAEFRRILWGSHEGDPVFEFGDVTPKGFIPHLRYDEEGPDGESVPQLEPPWAEDEKFATGKAHDWLRLQCAVCLTRPRASGAAAELQQICYDLLRCGRNQDARRVVKFMGEIASGVRRPEDRAECWQSVYFASRKAGDLRSAKAAEQHGREAAALIKDDEERDNWLQDDSWSDENQDERVATEPEIDRDLPFGEIEALIEKAGEATWRGQRKECAVRFDQALRCIRRQIRTPKQRREFLYFNFSQIADVAAWLLDSARMRKVLAIGRDEAAAGVGVAIVAESLLKMSMRNHGLRFVRWWIKKQRTRLARRCTREDVEDLTSMMPDLLEVLRQWGDEDEFLDAVDFYLRESFRGDRDPAHRVQRLAEVAKLYIRAGRREEFDDCICRIRELGPKIRDRAMRGIDLTVLIACFEESGDWDAALEVARRTRPPVTADVEFDMHLANKDWKKLYQSIRSRTVVRERADEYRRVARHLAPTLQEAGMITGPPWTED
jgi:hypothetical protein